MSIVICCRLRPEWSGNKQLGGWALYEDALWCACYETAANSPEGAEGYREGGGKGPRNSHRRSRLGVAQEEQTERSTDAACCLSFREGGSCIGCVRPLLPPQETNGWRRILLAAASAAKRANPLSALSTLGAPKAAHAEEAGIFSYVSLLPYQRQRVAK